MVQTARYERYPWDIFCLEDDSVATLEDNLGQSAYGDRGCDVSWTNAGFSVGDTEWHMYAFSKSANSILCRDGSCVNVGDALTNIPNVRLIYFNGGCGYGNFGQGIIIDEVRIYNRALSEQEISQHL